MAVVIVAYFNAINTTAGYDDITVFLNTTTGEITAAGNTESSYELSLIYGYSAPGTKIYDFDFLGNPYGVFAGTPYNTTHMETPFAYIAPVDDPAECDIAFLSIFTTDETIALNDGTITASAVSSVTGVEYSINGSSFFESGLFTGLAPGTYTVYAKDENGCTVTETAVILPYGGGPAVYNEKYYIEYSSAKDDSNIFRVSFKLRGYEGGSTRLTPAEQACVKRSINNNEDKYEPIIPSLLNINLIHKGDIVMSEFYSNDERQWKIEQTLNGETIFQGWLIPDEIQDLYIEPNYPITLTATDGLESLRGFQYLDDDGYPILGKLKLTEILQFCLAKLDYTATKRIICSIVSELDADSDYQYPSTELWSDAFYDDDFNPFDCYTVIEEICKAFGWTLKQVGGNFQFSLANDLAKTSGARIVTEYDEDFVFIDESTNFPVHKTIGITGDYKPVNPIQSIRYDKPLPKVSVTHDFTNYSIINTNRSFEIGAVEDGLPPGWTLFVPTGGETDTYQLKQVPYAYSGQWVLRAQGKLVAETTTLTSPDIPVDKVGQKVSITLSYLNSSPSDQGVSHGILFINFTRTSDSEVWRLATDGNWYQSPGELPPGVTFNHNLIPEFKDEWNSWSSPVGTQTGDFTNTIPGIGVIKFSFLGIDAYETDGETPIAPGIEAAQAFIDYDDLEIVISPVNERNNPLVGETWNIINKTKVFLGESRELNTILYDQPNNKYLNGNIFFNDTITNKWYAIGKPYDEASIGKILPIEIQANYQRPAIIWDGDILADDVDMSMVFTINGFGSKLFMPLSMEHDQRNGTVTISLVEIIDDTLIFDFQYVPKYSRNSRVIIS